MEQGTLSRRESHVLNLVAYGALAAVALTGAGNAPDTTVRWLTLGLCLLFGLTVYKTPTPDAHPAWC